MPTDELGFDAFIYGVGYMKNGQRVALTDVLIRKKPPMPTDRASIMQESAALKCEELGARYRNQGMGEAAIALDLAAANIRSLILPRKEPGGGRVAVLVRRARDEVRPATTGSPGKVVSRFWMFPESQGNPRFVVRHKADEGYFCHIYSEDQPDLAGA